MDGLPLYLDIGELVGHGVPLTEILLSVAGIVATGGSRDVPSLSRRPVEQFDRRAARRHDLPPCLLEVDARTDSPQKNI